MMKIAVAQALLKAHTYTEYRSIISNLLTQGKATGLQQSEELTHYSTLNHTRMNRLDKTIVIAEDVMMKLLSVKKRYTWLVLSEGWCGDAAQILPVVNKMALLSANIDLRIVFRDEHEELMNLYLTNGNKSIPKLLVVDTETDAVCANWGPRPKGASDLITSYKRQYGVIDETAKTELQLWYLHDKGLSTQHELIALMEDAENSFYAKR